MVKLFFKKNFVLLVIAILISGFFVFSGKANAGNPPTADIGLALTTPAPGPGNTIGVGGAVHEGDINAVNGTASVVITGTKTMSQTVTVVDYVGGTSSADDSLNVTSGGTAIAPTYTVNMTTPGDDVHIGGGLKKFILIVSEAGKSNISYTITVWVASPSPPGAPELEGFIWASGTALGTQATTVPAGTLKYIVGAAGAKTRPYAGEFLMEYENVLTADTDIAVTSGQHIFIALIEAMDEDTPGDLRVTKWANVTVADENIYAAPTTTTDEEDNQKAHIDSWDFSIITDRSSCPQKLKLEIKGKYFDNDAEVKIGEKKASAADVKSSKKIVAKFCLEKLLNDKVDQKRKVTVKNPGTKEKEAEKQINLGNLTSENKVAGASITNTQTSSSGDWDQKTKEGAKQIQEALNKLGYLDGENITSTFGSITMEAVKKFQSDNGIEATGFVGELTKAKLAEKLK